MLGVGDKIPFSAKLGNLETDKFIRVRVRNPAGVEIIGSPTTLTHDGIGEYTDTLGVNMPNELAVHAYYESFDDVLLTKRSNYLPATETFFLTDLGNIDEILDRLENLIVGASGAPVAAILEESELTLEIEDKKENLEIVDEGSTMTIIDENEVVDATIKENKSTDAIIEGTD